MGPPHVSEVCYRLNEYHLQIDFIQKESGYLDLQESGMKWNLHYCGKSSPVHLQLYVPVVVGDTVGHDALVVITNLAPQLLPSFVVHVYVRPRNLVIRRPGHMQNVLPIQLTKWSPTDSFRS